VGAERLETRAGGSGGAGEFGEVVSDAEESPFRLDLLDAAQQKLSEASCLLDLTKDRLDDLLAQSVTAASSRPLRLAEIGKKLLDEPMLDNAMLRDLAQEMVTPAAPTRRRRSPPGAARASPWRGSLLLLLQLSGIAKMTNLSSTERGSLHCG
jgi:hypothetical protein